MIENIASFHKIEKSSQGNSSSHGTPPKFLDALAVADTILNSLIVLIYIIEIYLIILLKRTNAAKLQHNLWLHFSVLVILTYTECALLDVLYYIIPNPQLPYFILDVLIFVFQSFGAFTLICINFSSLKLGLDAPF